MQQLIEANRQAFITQDVWPLTGHDCIPVDYKIWGIIQHRVYHRGVDPEGVGDVDHRKNVGVVRVCFDPLLIMSHSLFKTVV